MLISSKEAAEILEVNEAFVRSLCSRGKLACQKVGRTWVIDRESVLERKLNMVKHGGNLPAGRPTGWR
mgnify:CR=1 FL=1